MSRRVVAPPPERPPIPWKVWPGFDESMPRTLPGAGGAGVGTPPACARITIEATERASIWPRILPRWTLKSVVVFIAVSFFPVV